MVGGFKDERAGASRREHLRASPPLFASRTIDRITRVQYSFHRTLGTPLAWAVGAGFLGGSLAYDVTHSALHHHRPRSRLGRRMHELHVRHHFEDDARGFGVSTPWWDVVFGTAHHSSASAARSTSTPAAR